MKQIVMGLLGGILLLTACGQTVSVTPILASETNIVSKTAHAPVPSKTPREPRNEPTCTLVPPTPLPTIPTFTPTFEASTIVTVTPAPKADCQKINSNFTDYQFNFELYPSGNKYVGNSNINSIMEFLNSGRNIQNLINILNNIKANFSYQDITNDNIPDLILASGSLFQSLSIIYRSNGRYIRFPSEGDEWDALFGDQIQFTVQDANRNNIQDILSIAKTPTGLIAKIWEWNGQAFIDLTPSDAFTEGVVVTNIRLIELNNDGFSELLEEGVLDNSIYPGEPLRTEASTFYWDGKAFSPTMRLGNPEYRFQAIQDGDKMTIQRMYTKARKLYQTAIDSKALDWWSQDKFEQNREAAINFITPTVLPTDKTEYPRLAAYAYYRIILLHLVQGYESDAGTVYKTLQQKFGNDPYGQPYVQMATAFWDAYQSTHKMYDGCAAAIQYAAEHPEILTPLGSDYHGEQSHTYISADVCPFR